MKISAGKICISICPFSHFFYLHICQPPDFSIIFCSSKFRLYASMCGIILKDQGSFKKSLGKIHVQVFMQIIFETCKQFSLSMNSQPNLKCPGTLMRVVHLIHRTVRIFPVVGT